MARHNYQFEKRQRDLAKKQKKEEKRQRKLEHGNDPEGEAGSGEAAEVSETDQDTPATGEPTA